MKRTRHTFRLPPELADQLADYASRKRVSQAAVVEAALASFLSPDSSERMEAAFSRRLDRISRQLDKLDYHVEVGNEAIALFDCIHSLDRPSLLAALVKAGEKAGRFPPVYVQVNIGDEQQKGGVALDDVGAFLVQVRASPLPLEGLICIPPAEQQPGPYFALLAELARRHDVSGLSMGMSADYETAVLLGATAVRVGTALFN